MTETWRLIDTGLRSPAQNVALDRALLEARRAEEVPSTLRFLRFTPCALMGCNQSAVQELDLDYCQASGIGIQRRLTGGDVMYLDENQLVWELCLHRRDTGVADMRAVSRRLCHAAAAAVSALGVTARFRPPGDIEVDGRSLGGSAGVFDGEALLFQGALHVDLDAEVMLRASRFPGGTAAAARDRVASIKELLGVKPEVALIKRYLAEAFESEFTVEFAEGDLTLSEHVRYRSALREIDHPDWVGLVSRPAAELPVLQARRETAGGRLQAIVAYDRHAHVIRQVWFTSDVPIKPRRVLVDLEAALRYLPADRLAQRVERFFAGSGAEMPPLKPADFIEVVQLAVGQPLPTGINENS